MECFAHATYPPTGAARGQVFGLEGLKFGKGGTLVRDQGVIMKPP